MIDQIDGSTECPIVYCSYLNIIYSNSEDDQNSHDDCQM